MLFYRIQKMLQSKVPPYMLSNVDMYSLLDLEQVKTGALHAHIRQVVQAAAAHVIPCEVGAQMLKFFKRKKKNIPPFFLFLFSTIFFSPRFSTIKSDSCD